MSRRLAPCLRSASAALVAAVLAGGCGPLAFDPSIDVLLASDERTAGNVARLEEYLAGRTLVGVAVRHGDLFSPEGARDLGALSEDLELLDGVEDVKSLTHSGRPVLKGFSLDPREMLDKAVFLPPGAPADTDWQAARRRTLDSPLAANLLVSEDGTWAQVLVVARRDLSSGVATRLWRTEVESVVEHHRDRFLDVHVASFPFLELEMTETVVDNLHVVVLAAGALIVSILLVTFRSLTLLVVLGGLLALGLGTVAELFRLAGMSINLYTGMLFPLVGGLQLTFLVHLGTAWQEARRAGCGPRPAVAVALDRVLRPSFVAAATTVLGLLSLLTCDVGLVRAFGALGAAAVAVVFVLSFSAFWLLARRAGAEPGVSVGDHPRAARFTAGLAQRPWAAPALAVLVVAALAPGAQRVRSDARASEYLPQQSASARALRAVDAHLGGMNVFELELDSGAPGGIQTLPVLEFMESVRAFAERLDGVTAVYTYSQVLCLLNELWNKEAPGSRCLPTQPLLLEAFALALRHSRFALLDSLIDAEGQVGRVVLRTRDMPARRYLELLGAVSDFAEEERPEGVVLHARQGIHSLLAADRQLVASQLRSLGTCVLLVGLALVVLLGSFARAAAVLLVNLPALALVAGLLGYGGLPLNSVTVMVGAIVLGIAVDDSIHWLAFHARERERYDSTTAAVAATLAHKLPPIACTTAILCSCLLLFGMAPFPPVAHFGLLTAAALAFALVSVTFLLPSMVLLGMGGRRKTEERPSGSAG